MTEISTSNAPDILQPLGVDPASQDNAEKLPAGIIRVADKITMTAPTEGLGFRYRGDNWAYLIYSSRHQCLTVRGYYQHELLRYLSRDTSDGWYGAFHMVALPMGADPYAKMDLPEHPWRHHSWWKEHFLRHVEHFPTQSAKLPGLLSYYQTPGKRARDIRTPIKPGKYLKKFFGDVLSEEEIQTFAIEWHTWATPPELHVTQDADEIEEVYSNGPSSCMAGSADAFEGSEHPARVYAGPDLAVAYIGDLDEASGRTVVWPEKMIYGRLYGDYHRLEAALEAAGYRAGKDQEFHGARLRRIYEGGGSYTVPYVDFASYASDDGEFLIVGRGEVYLRRTDGLNQEIRRCGDCEEAVDDLNATRYNSVCDCCLEDNYFYCSVYEEYIQNDNRAPSPDEHPVSCYATSSRRAFYCDFTEMYYPREYYDAVQIVGHGTCEAEHAETIAFECDHSGEWYMNDRKVVLPDGRVVADCYHDVAIYDEVAMAA